MCIPGLAQYIVNVVSVKGLRHNDAIYAIHRYGFIELSVDELVIGVAFTHGRRQGAITTMRLKSLTDLCSVLLYAYCNLQLRKCFIGTESLTLGARSGRDGTRSPQRTSKTKDLQRDPGTVTPQAP